MLLLRRPHLGEVSVTVWPKILKETGAKKNIFLLEEEELQGRYPFLARLSREKLANIGKGQKRGNNIQGAR